MKYTPPVGGQPNDSYIDGNPATGTEGSPVPARAIEAPQREIVDVITASGQVPQDGDYTQLRQAIQKMIIAGQKAVVLDGATFDASVASGEVVRWDSGVGKFDEAVADGTTNNRAVGIADITNGKVYLYGECPLFAGLTPGARYYLHGSTPGAITTVAPVDSVMVGIAKSATTLWVDIDVVAPQQGVEPGSIIYVAKNSAPTGYLKANGAAVSRTAYAALFATIGTTFGVGDGATTFNLPDLRGEFVRGWDDGRGADAGRVFGSAQTDEIKSHQHSINMVAGGVTTRLAALNQSGGGGDVGGLSASYLTGGAETRPRNVALLACIKF